MAVTAAQAQSPRSFAVVSELAREVNVVIYQPAIGSRLGNNMTDRIAMPQGVLDKFVLNHTRNLLAKEAPGSRVFLVAPLDVDLFENMQSVVAGQSINVPADAMEAFKSQGSTHLIVYSKHRSPTAIRFGNRTDGTGSLEGLGFYIDRTVEVTSREDRQTGNGYLAPYLHARATLVDLASRKVVRTVEIREATAVANVRQDAKSTDAWDALSPNDKVRRLLEVLDRQVSLSVKQLLEPA